MKIVYYRVLLNRARNLTPTERIVYSFLVSKSISIIDEVFNTDGGNLNMEMLCDYLQTNHNSVYLYRMSISQMMDYLNITKHTVIDSMKRLRELNYISGDYIFVNKELIEGGYFELYRHDILTGQTLIFYSYLKDKSKKYGGCVDTYRSKLAQIFDVKVYSIEQYLAKLSKAGLTKRLDNGKLKIL